MKNNINVRELISQSLKKSLKVRCIILALLILAVHNGHATSIYSDDLTLDNQQVTVTGIVTDAATGDILPGVYVLVSGTTIGTTTDLEGKYSLQVPNASVLLRFSFIGYLTQEISLAGRTVLDVALASDVSQLEEIVVIGYGTQKKVSMTSAVSAVSGEKLTERTVANLQQSLQGKLTGLTILDLGAAPGKTNYSLRVRGITTLSSNNPLVIIDGIEQELSDINPNDIETVTLLKDASSTAIYGSRAANGVILITTKRGKSGKLSLAYSGYYALQKSNDLPTHMETREYMEMQNIAWINTYGYPTFTQEYIDEYVAGEKTDPLKYPKVNDWHNIVLKVAPMMSHTLTATGGSETVKALFSTRIQDQEGIIPNSEAKIREIRVNTDMQVFKNLSVGTDLNYRYRNRLSPTQERAVFNRILQLSQFTVPKYPDGTYGVSSDGHNPLMYAEIGGLSRFREDYITGSIKADLNIIEGLKLSVQYGGYINSNYEKNYTNSYQIRDYYDPNVIKKTVSPNKLTEVRNSTREFTLNSLLTYTNTFGAHFVNALAGYSQIQNTNNNLSAYRQNFFNNDIQSLSQGADDASRTNSGIDSEWALSSYFGRVNYTYLDKYLFEINARYDGSSRFASGNKFSFFPSYSLGWRISKEEFWGKLDQAINEAKIRVSYGKTGNQAVSLYTYIPTLGLQTYTFNDQAVSGLVQTTMANPDITWETTTQTNFGIDLEFLKSRILLSVDYYYKRTDDILLVLPVPGILGLTASAQNAGRVDNKGWEFLLESKNRFGQFSFNGNLAFNINHNKVIDLAGTGPYIGTNQETRKMTGEGYPIDCFWGYRTDGYFQTEEEVASYPNIRSQIAPGDVKFLDLNHDEAITPADMTYLGPSFPVYTFSSTWDMKYKNFGLSLFWQGAGGYWARVGGALEEMGIWGSFCSKYVTNNYWTPENRNAKLPRPLKFDNRNINFADRDRTDGTYLRLKNIQLSYEMPSRLSQRIGIDNIVIYAAVTNLLTFAALNELEVDPESIGRKEQYPQTSLKTIGINIKF